MKKSVFLICTILLLTSCTAGNYDCEGEIIIENEIPDIALELGEEPFRRDVFEEPVVFSHTDGKHITISATTEETVAIAGRKNNEQTGELSIVEVIPNSIGTTMVRVTATEECPDYEKVLSFQVTVMDSTSD